MEEKKRLGTGSTKIAAQLLYGDPCCVLNSADSIAFFKAAAVINSQAFCLSLSVCYFGDSVYCRTAHLTPMYA